MMTLPANRLRRRLRCWATILLVTSVAVSAADESGETDPASLNPVIGRYLEAVRTEDWETMASLLAPDAHYLDSAMTIFDRPPIDLRGPEAIIGFFQRANADSGTEEVRYDIQRHWTSGDTTVLDIRVSVRAGGAFFDVGRETIEIETPLITILRLEEGKVTYHADYPDYAEALEQIDALRTQFGSADLADERSK